MRSMSQTPSVHASGTARRQRSGLHTVASLLPYLWPRGEPAARVLLVLAKVATVYVPVVYSRAVDALSPKGSTTLLVIPAALIVAYGLLRVASSGFAELRDAVFASVQQRIARKLALQTFEHLHRQL